MRGVEMGVGDVEDGVKLGSAGDNSRGLLGWFDGRQSLGRTWYSATVPRCTMCSLQDHPRTYFRPSRWLGCNVVALVQGL